MPAAAVTDDPFGRQAQMRRTLRRSLIVGLLMAGGSTTLSAHLRLAKSSPTEGATLVASPKRLQLWFTEEPLLPLSAVTLTGPKGNVTLEALRPGEERSLTAAVGTALPPGSYRIAWKAAGDDGHVVTGTVDFTVKESTRPPM